MHPPTVRKRRVARGGWGVAPPAHCRVAVETHRRLPAELPTAGPSPVLTHRAQLLPPASRGTAPARAAAVVRLTRTLPLSPPPGRVTTMVAPIVIAVGVPLAVGFVASTVSAPGILKWYPKLKKPSWTPPTPAFGPIWSSLYVAMGLASHRVYQAVGFSRSSPLWMLYSAQLALNAAWNPLVFVGRKLDVALVEVVALLGTAAATAVRFGTIDAVAGRLMVPYVGWIAYAAALNGALWRMNPASRLIKGKEADADAGADGAPAVAE